MRLRTIWTMPAASIMERLRRTRDWGAAAIGRKLPLRIRYFVTVGEMANASIKDPTTVVPEMTIMDVMEKLDKPRSIA